ncbi:MAG TPA: glycosyltransferase family 1 protein, partial [Segetibacter sp.]
KQAENLLRDNKIDLIYYLRPEWEILNYPFIATHWDNCHKSIPPFPEVALDGMYEKREKYHLYTLNKALAILCESYAGVKEVQKLNTYQEDKIKMLPIFAGEVINKSYPETEQQQTLSKFNLQKEKYFIYPAQFWAHKNHYNIITAFQKLIAETKDEQLKLVLCGSDKGNFDYITDVIRSLSLTDRILTPGFVSVKELNIFYRNAIALTMPTFLGPSNMPLIEAAHLRCPVLCSDLEGHREILGDNALYFAPTDSDSMKNAMVQILDKQRREQLSESAYLYIQQSHFNLENALNILNRTLCELIPIRKTWGY